jgi:4-hydroxybutyryl-CoA dehydratase/vinylacetyl-CoA-Delta-isomerase
MLANVCKHHVTKLPFEIGRLAQDLAGGLVATMPSLADLHHDEIGPLLRRLLVGRADVPVENRLKILRLIENMTMGRNAVGYLTESVHGAGSPQAQRVQIARAMQLDYKRRLARNLAQVDDGADPDDHQEVDGYLAAVFRSPRVG